MWFILALASSLFAALTTILAKIKICSCAKSTDANICSLTAITVFRRRMYFKPPARDLFDPGLLHFNVISSRKIRENYCMIRSEKGDE